MQRMTTCQAQESLKNICKVPVAKFKPRSSDLRNFPFTYRQSFSFSGPKPVVQMLVSLVLSRKGSCCLWESGKVLGIKERGLILVS